MKKALLIINTNASQGAKNLEEATRILNSLGIEVVQGKPKDANDYTRVIKEHQSQVDLVIVGGGDGTIQCAAEGILETSLPLGILPLGTANNVARSLQLPLKLKEACAAIVNGKATSVDLAKVNERLFVSVVGIGFSTDVHNTVPKEEKKRWGSLAYFFQALRLARSARKSFVAEIKSDTQHIRVRAYQVTICNGRFFGAHVAIHEDAKINDGLLDISIIKKENFLKGFIRMLMPTQRSQISPGLQILHSKRFEVKTYPSKMIDVEGATDLETPATFEVLPAAIKVITHEATFN